MGGWSLYTHDGKLKYCYNFCGIEYYYVTADEPIPVGDHEIDIGADGHDHLVTAEDKLNIAMSRQ